MNLFQRFEETARRQPDRLALQIKEGTGYRRLTFGDVAEQAMRFRLDKLDVRSPQGGPTSVRADIPLS